MDILLSLFLFLRALAGMPDPGDPGGGTLADTWKTVMAAARHDQQPNAGTSEPPPSPSASAPADPDPQTDPHADPQPDAPKVKGIYVTAYSAGGARMASLLELLDTTALNAMVIDLKDDHGYITYKTDNPKLQQYGAPQNFIGDMDKLMTRLEEHDVYPIARIVVFKDNILADRRPELSFVNKDGTVWHNSNKHKFVNPYSKEVWDYNLEAAKEAARLGFKEIQFDYVRFPEGFEKKADALTFEQDGQSRVDAVAAFVEYAKKELAPLGVRVSVDIFGYAASVPAAEGIGQDFVKISAGVDVICPMIYPSHYSTGWFGQKDPDKAPYETIKGAMDDTHKKLDPLGEEQPIIRPWIQDFTAGWLGKGHYVSYGAAQVNAQIKALRDSGVEEYLLWNSGNKYTAGVDY